MAIITLTTDFGQADAFVGTMKGVILGIAPGTRLVDLTHEVAPGDVRSAAFALASSAPFFPRGTIHLVVVDPGVGGHRRAIAALADGHTFVGPDNGVLSWALQKGRKCRVRSLENQKLHLPHRSATFHGRDVFAPVAAHLAAGLSFSKLGPAQPRWVSLDWPAPQPDEGTVAGRILYIDRFGNGITNLPNELVADGAFTLKVAGRRMKVRDHYGAAGKGRLVALPGSAGYLEVAVNQGHAARRLGLRLGSPVLLRA